MNKIEFPYHLHIDATVLPTAMEAYAKDVGFWEADFAGHPEGFRHFEPNRHLTLKLRTKAEFDVAFERLKERAAELGLIGYIEGEFLVSDMPITTKPYTDFHDRIPIPFQIQRRLLAGLPNEDFRETEAHLVLDKDRSDASLIRKLLEAGLYGAYVRKKDYVALVLTFQGFRRDVDLISGAVLNYLGEVGGAVRCSLQEERAIGHYMIGIDHTRLPEIIGKIEWHSDEARERAASTIKLMRKNRKGEETAARQRVQIRLPAGK